MTSGSEESYPGHTVGLKRVFGDIARVELSEGLTAKEPHIVRYFSANDVERFRHARFTSGSKPIGVRTADQDSFGPCCQRHQDIQARTNAAVHQDLDVRTLECGRDFV
jgi:hypothetical protein